jgi:hypothetical protein
VNEKLSNYFQLAWGLIRMPQFFKWMSKKNVEPILVSVVDLRFAKLASFFVQESQLIHETLKISTVQIASDKNYSKCVFCGCVVRLVM